MLAFLYFVALVTELRRALDYSLTDYPITDTAKGQLDARLWRANMRAFRLLSR